VHDHNGPEQPDVVVAVDWTGPALHAIRWAAAEASRRSAPLRIVHAAPYTRKGILGERRAAWLLALAKTIAQYAHPPVPTRTEWVTGADLGTALREAAEGAQLLVVGTGGASWCGAGLPHSVVGDICAAAACPVVVVPTRQARPPADGPVVVAVEDLDRDASALTAAFNAARGNASALVVLHIVHGVGWPVAHAPEPDGPARAAITRALVPWRCRYPDVPVEVRVVPGFPSPELREAATAARLIVVSARGRRHAGRPVLDRTGRALARHCACPVVIVRSERSRHRKGAAGECRSGPRRGGCPPRPRPNSGNARCRRGPRHVLDDVSGKRGCRRMAAPRGSGSSRTAP
jgi:nucleotide-binding universal stress UspA family protein